MNLAGAQPGPGAQDTVARVAVAVPVTFIGLLGAVLHGGPLETPTLTVISADGALTPAALRALTRTKYIPAGAVAVSPVTLPTSPWNALLNDGAVPASRTYDVAPAAAPQESVTVKLLTIAPRPTGGGGPAGCAYPLLTSAAIKNTAATIDRTLLRPTVWAEFLPTRKNF